MLLGPSGFHWIVGVSQTWFSLGILLTTQALDLLHTGARTVFAEGLGKSSYRSGDPGSWGVYEFAHMARRGREASR